VLAKRSKIEVRSDKRLGLDPVAKDLKIPGGYLEELQDT
jgi:cytoskeletal protein RodZ